MQPGPPSASPLAGLCASIAEASMRLPKGRAYLIVAIAFALLGAADMVTGVQVNLTSGYIIVTCFSSWCLGETAGLVVAGLSVVAYTAINGFGVTASEGHLHIAAAIWNLIGRCFSLSFLAILASGLRHSLDEARWSATTDGLTGVLNKAAFTRRLGPLVAQAQRRGDSLVMAYIDLDGFKGVNDGFGHAAGDALLCSFAESAVETIRANDLFARIGGDEFITLMTVPSCTQGDIAAERLHDRLSRILNATGHVVTCSVGALVVEARQVSSVDRLIQAADGLMYEVKRSGKNALRVARADIQAIPADQPFVPIPDRRRSVRAVAV